MNKKNMLMGLVLMLSLAMWSPTVILAGEHGGTEHGGTKVEGSHGMMDDHVGTLRDAAKALKEDGHAELAAKIEEMAKMKEKM